MGVLGLRAPPGVCFYNVKDIFPSECFLNKATSGLGAALLSSMQRLPHLLGRWALDSQLKDSFARRVCVKPLASVRPVSRVHGVCRPVGGGSGEWFLGGRCDFSLGGSPACSRSSFPAAMRLCPHGRSPAALLSLFSSKLVS